MTLLTRMPLNPARRGTRQLLASPQAMHAAVLAAFPPDLAVAETSNDRVLWRVDHDNPHRVLLYVCSAAPPDLTHLVEQAGWPTTSGWDTRDYSPLLDRLTPGQRWAFRLTANPVRSLRTDKHPSRGAVRGHVTAAQQTAWLVRRAPEAGFTLATTAASDPAVVVRDRRVVTFPRQANMVTLATATFDGVLDVRDAARLRQTLTCGLGRAKSYGCGLLTLAHAPA